MKLPAIYSFNECSEVMENVFAPTIFLGGCNLKCPYCMNAALIDKKPDLDPMPLETIKVYIEETKPEWITISGGEPTCAGLHELTNLICLLKEWGCKVALCTNGTKQYKLRELLPLLNYVAMDYKTSTNEHYQRLSDHISSKAIISVSHSKVLLMLEKQARDDFDYEIRTTMHPEIVDPTDVDNIISTLVPGEQWVIQQFRKVQDMPDPKAADVALYTDEALEEMVEKAKKQTDRVKVRYV